MIAGKSMLRLISMGGSNVMNGNIQDGTNDYIINKLGGG
jgi:hypothetical protein